MRIIVAIDIIGGKCVRLTRGDFDSKKIYNDDPLEVAIEVENNGIGYLHLVDLDGAKNKRIENLKILEKIASETGLKIDFGGGIRTIDDVRMVLNAGASQVTLGSIAVKDKPLFLKCLGEFGPDRIILGADCKDRKISAAGWLEESETDVVTFISEYTSLGVKYTVCTDIDKDGMLQGPSVELYRDILAATNVSLIASGGITTLQDIENVQSAGCEGAIIGKAIYEGKLTLNELGKLC
jgi:phosphoribosylformimino-5-aminoimidazole carboxamide ribotide isomerase